VTAILSIKIPLFRATINPVYAASHAPMCCEECSSVISVVPAYGRDDARRVVAYRGGAGGFEDIQTRVATAVEISPVAGG
jgi:hypothetical protein